MNIVILALPVLSTLLARTRLTQQELEKGTLNTTRYLVVLALCARIRSTRARDAEADADAADAAAQSSYRPWVPGQRTLSPFFFPFALESHRSYVRSMCLGLPQWRATRTQIEEPARHQKKGEQQSPQVLGKWPSPAISLPPPASPHIDVGRRFAGGHSPTSSICTCLTRICCLFCVFARGWVAAQRSARHCTVTPNTAAYLHFAFDRTQ